ncbi:hypothetical protein HJC23_003413 [Cyclotella cryptica]|uniref:SAYSvFN domain-containing protein n=1 Tax=Cyclotella cryptica TaxID=29204 RepID=A0ABD3QS04_9STRA
MPPPRPNFLPPNHLRRQRQLDPTRQLTSRELWNQVRFHSTPPPPDSASSSNEASSYSWKYYQSLSKAILYEIQPFRIKPALRRLRVFFLEEDGWRKSCVICIERAKTAGSFILRSIQYSYEFVKKINVESIRAFLQSNANILRYGVPSCVGLYIYCRLLSYLHELLHAGPMVFILTLLILLYTIGLGENTGAASGIPSAYSVFNRGVQRLFGSEDAEQLAHQFVHAAAGRGLAAGAGRNGMGVGGGQFWVDDDDDMGENSNDDEDAVLDRRRRRRLERLQRRNDHNDDAIAGGHAQQIQENGDIALGQSNSNGEVGPAREDELRNNERDENRAARKSGKKARRKNLELRREMHRQRQAAVALGFGGDDINEVARVANLRVMELADQVIDD